VAEGLKCGIWGKTAEYGVKLKVKNTSKLGTSGFGGIA
jgi:hypothetical protein